MTAKSTQKTSTKGAEPAQPSRLATLGWVAVWIVLGYIAASKAIDTASWWYYVAVGICGAQLVRCVKVIVQGHGR